jgi:diguanylate cyclase (GGDEF)-like protein
MKALIVDNSRSYSIHLAEILNESNISSVVCTCVAEALAKCEEQNFEFICTSLVLKDGSGLELSSLYRERYPKSTTSIYLITSNKEVYRDRNWLSSGITDAFYKSDLERFTLELKSLAKLQVKKNISGKVLYVEDSRAESMVTMEILKNNGMEIVHFDNAEAAWDSFMQAGDYDLVITDLVLSGLMTGLSLVRCIRSININSDLNDSWVPIIGVTGFDDVSRRVDLYNAGIDDYVAKPVVETELIARVSNNITLKKLFNKVTQQQKELEKLASIDSLTGCLNRRSFLDMAEKYLAMANRNKQHLSLFYMDLDHFKQINDTYGHAEGDAVLVRLGALLRKYCRKGDVVSRFGGEEFVMLLPNCNPDDAHDNAEKIRQRINEIQCHDDKISISIGISSDKPDMYTKFDSLLASADQALLEAKDQGRNCVVSYECLDIKAIKKAC